MHIGRKCFFTHARPYRLFVLTLHCNFYFINFKLSFWSFSPHIIYLRTNITRGRPRLERQELLERRRIVVDGLAEIGLPLEVEPNGAFYAYFNISSTGLDAWTFCERALKEAHIALTPGRDFGEATADTHVRLSYAASREALREGLKRLGDFVAKVRG